MANKNVSFGLAIGAIVLVAGIAGLGIYRQGVFLPDEDPAPIERFQADKGIPGMEAVVSDSLEPLSSKKVAIPSNCAVDKVDGTIAFVPCDDLVQENMIDNPFATFDEYVEHTKRTMIPELVRANYENSLNGEMLEKKVNDELDRLSGSYEFWKEMVDGHPALFHRRNFYGMIGSVYEMHIDAGNGMVIILSSEIDNDILDAIYHSYGVAASSDSLENSADWRTYKNTYKSAGTFSFKYPSWICDSENRDCRPLKLTEKDSIIALDDPGRGHFAIYYGSDIANEKSANSFLQATLKNSLCKIDSLNTYTVEGTAIKNVFLNDGCSLYGPEYEKYSSAHPEAIGLSGKVRAYWAMDSKELIVYELGRGGGCAFAVCSIEEEISKSMELSEVSFEREFYL